MPERVRGRWSRQRAARQRGALQQPAAAPPALPQPPGGPQPGCCTHPRVHGDQGQHQAQQQAEHDERDVERAVGAGGSKPVEQQAANGGAAGIGGHRDRQQGVKVPVVLLPRRHPGVVPGLRHVLRTHAWGGGGCRRCRQRRHRQRSSSSSMVGHPPSGRHRQIIANDHSGAHRGWEEGQVLFSKRSPAG